MEPSSYFRLKMTEHTGPGDSPAGGWGRGLSSESDSGSKDERLLPRCGAWATDWTDSGVIH